MSQRAYHLEHHSSTGWFMKGVSASVDMPVARDEAHDVLAVIANEPLTEHLLQDWSCRGSESDVGPAPASPPDSAPSTVAAGTR